MAEIKIGIPKAFLYYKYQIMWRSFFEELGLNVVVSPNTNKAILDAGINASIDESCTSAKVYMGHVEWLIGKCDYIFVPRIAIYENGDATCTKFYGIYDIVRATFPQAKLIHINIDYEDGQTEWNAYKKLGDELGAKPAAVKQAYKNAAAALKNYELELQAAQHALLQSPKLKVLIVAHPYNIYDALIGEPIVRALESLNAAVLYADIPDIAHMCEKSKTISRTMYWRYNKHLTGSIVHYSDKIDGIIFMTTFPCGPDSLAIELIQRKVKDIPMTNLVIDSNFGEAGLHTRIESFIDILEAKKETSK
ncbi:MAG: acyl-CoA dehydratase activase-related protein [Defluviitaleaceae bacterium]|nr:acyl-CoA dehydratase activase-related protein [Defluviitaleaceae bacterium]MCL2263026.1 acyl-CoA dehydratase activase-related protein [Defluviitaleaceae bacterium]